LVLGILVVLFFWRVFLLGEALVPADLLSLYFPWKPYFPSDFEPQNFYTTDIIDSQYPARAVAVHLLEAGQWPLWDPYTSSGRPFGIFPIYALSFPLNFLLLILPVELGFTYVAIIRFFIAGAAMYAFLRELEVGQAASLFGGVVFAFNGFTVVWLHATAGVTLSMASLVFWAGERLLRRQNLKNVTLLALSVFALVSGGFLAIALYVLYALTAYILFRVGMGVWKSRRWRDGVKKLVLCGSAILIGIALISPVLLPFVDHLRLTSYDEQREGRGTASETLINVIRYLIPDYYGRPVTKDVYGNYPERTAYLGILPLFLTALALTLAKRKATVWFFAGLMIISFGMVYGAPWIQLMARLPGLSINNPTRLKSLVVLSVAVLAAYGLDGLQKRSPERTRLSVWVVMGVLFVAQVAIIVLTEQSWLSIITGRKPFDRTLWMLWQSDRLTHPSFERSLFYLLWLLIALLLLTARAKGFLSSRAVGIGAILLISFDLLGWGSSYLLPIDRSLVFPRTPGIEFLHRDPDFFRVTGVDRTLFPNTPGLYELQDIAGHDPLAPDRYRDVLSRVDPDARFGARGTVLGLYTATADLSSPLLDLLNLKYIVDEPGAANQEQITQDGTWVVAHTGPDMTIYRNTEVLPRCYLADQVEVVPDPEAILDRLATGQTDTRRIALVEEELREPIESRNGEHSMPQIITYEANEIVINTQAEESAFLVLGDIYYPGWEARLDGKPTKIYRTNYIFRGVYLPPGSHEVKFNFRPQPYYVGWGVRLSAVLLLTVAGVWRSWQAFSQRRKTSEVDAHE
jgi:hypothetical protein